MLKKLADKTFIKFLAVGVLNTLFGAAVMFVAYNLFGLSYWLSSAANYILGSTLSFFLNKHFTFRHEGRSISVVLKYILNILVCYLVAHGIAKPLAARILAGSAQNVQENTAMLAGMVIFTLMNYFGQRYFAFRGPARGDNGDADSPASRP